MYEIFTCPKCNLTCRVSPKGLTFDSSHGCPELSGTIYGDPSNIAYHSPEWCPHMSDAAPEDTVLLPKGYRATVEAAIAAAKAKG
jgi:hypothetical protein